MRGEGGKRGEGERGDVSKFGRRMHRGVEGHGEARGEVGESETGRG